MNSSGNRWLVIVGALIIQAILGTVYGFSVFVRPLEMEFGWDRATTQWAFSFALAFFALSMIPAGRLQDRIGPRKVAMIGGVLLGLSFLLGAMIVDGTRPWALYLTYGVIGGTGIGFGYVCPIAASVKWFPDKKGLITGLAVAGFGAGALFFAGPASALLMPSSPDHALGLGDVLMVGLGIMSEVPGGIGWRSFFVMHGVVAAIAVVGGALLLKNPPAGYRPAGWEPKPGSAEAGNDKDWQQMLDTPLAGVLWLTFIFGATSGLMAIGQWTPMMADVLGGKSLAPDWMGGFGRFVEPVGILAIFNALGRIVWGKVSDLIDRPRAMMIMYLFQGLAFMMLVSVNSAWAVFLFSALVGMNFGGNFALFPSATADYFGTKHFGVNYGFMFTAYGVAGIMGPVVGGILFDATGKYVLASVFAGILCFLAAATAVVVWGFARRPVVVK